MPRIFPTICFVAKAAWHREVRQFANPQSPKAIEANNVAGAHLENRPRTMGSGEGDPMRQALGQLKQPPIQSSRFGGTSPRL